MATFQGVPHIGEKILKYFDLEVRLVCKSWNEILDNPQFWLKKLRKLGQSKKANEKWQKLIAKCEQFDISQNRLILGLKKEFYFNKQTKHATLRKFLSSLARSPIRTAIKFGIVDLVKVFVELEEYFDEPIEPNLFEKISEVPIMEALKKGQMEIVTIMMSRLKFKETSIKDIFREVTKLDDGTDCTNECMDKLDRLFQMVDQDVIVEAIKQGFVSAEKRKEEGFFVRNSETFLEIFITHNIYSVSL